MILKKIATIPLKLLKVNYAQIFKELLFYSRFFILVVLYLLFDLIRIIGSIWPIRYITKPFSVPAGNTKNKVLSIFNLKSEGEISSLDLVHLAIRHLKAKKIRTIITIGGMSIGFGSVIFLLSLGYGAQRLVVSRVARLDEMRQITVTVGQANALSLSKETLDSFSAMDGVEKVLPMVSTVSKVNYNNSVSDVVVYAVSRAFLEESAIQPSQGKLFDDSDVAARIVPADEGQVAGVEDEPYFGAKLYKEYSSVRYAIHPIIWKPVYAEPSENAEILGYTSRIPGMHNASETWGNEYNASPEVPKGIDGFGNQYHVWIKDTFPLWEVAPCLPSDIDCVADNYRVKKSGINQLHSQGYITEMDVSVERYSIIEESPKSLAEGTELGPIQFGISPGKYAQVYSGLQQENEVINMFTSSYDNETLYSGDLIVGAAYSDADGWGSFAQNDNGANVGLWIRTKVPLWRKLDCASCTDQYLREVDQNEKQVESHAYVHASVVSIEDLDSPPKYGKVLGETTEIASDATPSANPVVASDSSSLEEVEETEIDLGDGTIITAQTLEDGTIDWVTIASGEATLTSEDREVIPYPTGSKREAIVNEAMLNMLGITVSEALGKQFDAVFLLDQEFFSKENYQVESESATFTIIGVIPGDKNAAYYVPFNDIQGLGTEHYSQVKIVVSDQDKLADIRQNIESLGYKTTSVVDTVGKINELFDTVRLLLTSLGLVALSVAALGMFNTLTVSLLEKTREVGLMKTIGMKSNEVKRLFIAESIVMGLSGGIFGLILSCGAGYTLSFILSSIAITKGLGYIQIVYTPPYLAAGIVAVAFLVGVITGLYPSHRATKISALNALRYE